MNPQDWIPSHQIGFRQAQSTVQQCHRIKNIINKVLENQQYCTAAFLDVRQAFDKMAPTATIQNQNISTLKLFHPAEIVPK